MLTRLFAARVPAQRPGAEAERLALAPVVGEALQLTNIFLDWPVDIRRGRCFVPASWLAEYALAPGDLVGRDHPGVRALAARLESRARDSLARVPDYLALIPLTAVRFRLFCLWPRWAAGSPRARRRPEFTGSKTPPPRASCGARDRSAFVPPERRCGAPASRPPDPTRIRVRDPCPPPPRGGGLARPPACSSFICSP
jgi:hypothetical protein